MSEKAIQKRTLVNTARSFLPIVFLLALVSLLYVFTQRFPENVNVFCVPSGDPFSYTISWILFLKKAQLEYFATLWNAFNGSMSWYQLQVLLISLLSPLMRSDPVSIAVINFFSFFVVSTSLYRVGAYLTHNRKFGLLLALVYWLFPGHYNQAQAVSLFNLMLDSTFVNFLFAALLNLLIYAFRPRSLWSGIWAAFLMGLAIWGRGNSLMYLLIVASVPVFMIIRQILQEKDRGERVRLCLSFGIFCTVVVVLSSLYYSHHLATIVGYYTPHKSMMQGVHFSLKKMAALFIDFPGVYFSIRTYGTPGGWTTVFASLLSHLFVCFTLIWMRIRPLTNLRGRAKKLKDMSLIGAVIYWGVFWSVSIPQHNGILSDNGFVLVKQPFYPMLIGLFLCGISMVLYFVWKKEARLNLWEFKMKMCLALSPFFILTYAVLCTKESYKGFDISRKPSARQVKEFSLKMEELFPQSSIVFLWYDLYNAPIINYYRILGNVSPLPTVAYKRDAGGTCFLTNEHTDALWIPNPHIDEEKMKRSLEQVVFNSDVVIVPEKLSCYNCDLPYPIYQKNHLIKEVFSSPRASEFIVRMILREGQMRLLVLQKKSCGVVGDELPTTFFCSDAHAEEFPQAMILE